MPVSIPPSKDIPPARRQSTDIPLAEIENMRLTSPKPKRHGLRWFAGLLLLAGIGSAGYWQRGWLVPRAAGAVTGAREAIAQADFAFWREDAADDVTVNEKAAGASAVPTAETSSTDLDSEIPSELEAPVTSNPVAIEGSDRLLNHRRYEVAAIEKLVVLNPSSEIRLQPDAQAAIMQMLEKAKAEGVKLGLISGFRTLADQDYLYFDLKAERGESAQTRAEVSAPPGYSEHHTGYAVDFIDESKPNTHLEESFETTDAFKWLEKNAAFFNFEMSFPKDNEDNVGYEPWHWRYVGNQESLELFYK